MKNLVLQYVETWTNRCYFDGIPDTVPARLVQLKKAPSWRTASMAILRNDGRLLGEARPSYDIYDTLKKIELQERYNRPVQLRLF